jgi:hypothetical protein
MFADEKYSGKFINEYEGIENATYEPPAPLAEQLERATQRITKLARTIAERLTPIVNIATEAVKILIEIHNEALRVYPNRRVVYLAKHGSPRVRKKNLKRIYNNYRRIKNDGI